MTGLSSIWRQLVSRWIAAVLVISGFLITAAYLPVPARADTFIDSDITTDTTWALVDSPFVVINDVTVTPGATLTIEPGVWVKFAEGFKLRVEGNLTAVGTPGAMIIFTSNKLSPEPGDYDTVEFAGDANSTFEIRFVWLRYGSNGLTLASPDQGRYLIEWSWIELMSVSGIYITQPNSDNSTIRENILSTNPTGIRASAATLRNLDITRNTIAYAQNGIYLSSPSGDYSESSMSNITIDDNHIEEVSLDGIILSSSSERWSKSSISNVSITDNDVRRASQDGIVLVSSVSYLSSSSVSNVTLAGNVVQNASNTGIAVTSSTSQDSDSCISNITIRGNTVSNSSRDGIALTSTVGYRSVACISAAALTANTVRSSAMTGINIASSVAYRATSLVSNISAHNNTLQGVGTGISLDSSSQSTRSASFIANITFTDNTVVDATQDGIVLASSGPSYTESSFSNVTTSGNTIMGVRAGIYLYTDLSSGSTATFVNLTLNRNEISNSVYGVRLKAYAYSGQVSVSGVTIADSVVSNASGYGIVLSSSAYWSLTPIYGVSLTNNTVFGSGSTGILTIGSSQLSIDVTISESRVYSNSEGIVVDGGHRASIIHSSIAYNSNEGVFFSESQANLASFNDIYSNGYGMMVTDGATVNAEQNFWGDASGPYHESVNPNGRGNPVNGNGVDLDFVPWRGTPNRPLNERPIAKLTADKTVLALGEDVTLDASLSTDDTAVSRYFFDYGDGTESGWASNPIILHNYSVAGMYVARLTVMDEFGVLSNNTAEVVLHVDLPWETHLFILEPDLGELQTNPLWFTSTGDVTGEVVFAGLGRSEDLVGTDLMGKIALIERGETLFRDKVQNVTDAGATGAIIHNNETGNFGGTLLEPSAIPAVSISKQDGLELREMLDRGDTVLANIVVTALHEPPVASFTVSPLSGDVSTAFLVDASSSSDAEDPSDWLEVRWDWEDDGVWDTSWTTTKTAQRRYGELGTYTIRLEVRDTDWFTDQATRQVGVNNVGPVASFTLIPSTGDVTATFAVDASPSSDLEDPTSELEVQWDWEDDGDWDTPWSKTKTATHQYTSPGTYTIRLQVRDTGGLADSTTRQVEVQEAPVNTPPAASFVVTPPFGSTSTTFTFDASSSSDVEDALAKLEVRWDWEDDGTFDTPWSTLKTAQHRYSSSGTYDIRLEVRDTGNLSDSHVISVLVTSADLSTEVLQEQTGSITFSLDRSFQMSRSLGTVAGASASISVEVDVSFSLPAGIVAESNSTTAAKGGGAWIIVTAEGARGSVSLTLRVTASLGSESETISRTITASLQTPMGSSQATFDTISIPAMDVVLAQVTLDLTPGVRLGGYIGGDITVRGPGTANAADLIWRDQGGRRLVLVAFQDEQDVEVRLSSAYLSINELAVTMGIGGTVSVLGSETSINLGTIATPPMATSLVAQGSPSSLMLAKFSGPSGFGLSLDLISPENLVWIAIPVIVILALVIVAVRRRRKRPPTSPEEP